MVDVRKLQTPRLLLRPWLQQDYPEFARLNADPEVMGYFPRPLSRQESDDMADKLNTELLARGWGVWAVAMLADKRFIGFTGLSPYSGMPFADGIEIAWRLSRPAWGQGFATEAARQALDVAFTDLQLNEVVAFTSVLNTRSIAVMEKLAMRRDEKTFLHPRVEAGHKLQEHVLYRINREDYLKRIS